MAGKGGLWRARSRSSDVAEGAAASEAELLPQAVRQDAEHAGAAGRGYRSGCQETGSTWQTVYRIKQRALVLRKLLAPCSLESERCKLTAAPIALV